MPVGRTASYHHVGCTLYEATNDGLATAVREVMERRHELVFGVEGHFGNARIRAPCLIDVQPALRSEDDQGTLRGIADHGFAVQRGIGAENHRQQVRIEVEVLPADMQYLPSGAVA